MDKSALFLDGWIEFNKHKWNVKPIKVHITPENKEKPFIDAIYYLDNKNRIVTPKMNAYLPIYFESTPTKIVPKLYRQWLEVVDLLLKNMEKYNFKIISLPPDITDIRIWSWANYENRVAYTFIIDFPFNEMDFDSSVRKQVKKSKRDGFTVCKTKNMDDVYLCLKETEERQNFDHKISKEDLELALNFVGEENFRCYVCYAQNGEPASARIVLFKKNSRVIDLLAGTTRKYLHSGATQLIINSILEDVQKAGATGFDFCGANIPNVAKAKSDWGGKLTPFYIIESHHWKWYARQTLKFLKLRKGS